MNKLYRLTGRLLFKLMLPVMAVFLNRTKRTYVAVIHDKKVLLVKNWLDYDKWRLPGGGINRNESASVAAAREIREELGIIIDPQNLVSFAADNVARNRLRITCIYWYCIVEEIPKTRKHAFEIVDVGWFDALPAQFNTELASVFKSLTDAELL